MSTHITRGPKVCPTCGEENRPTAVQCWLCLTPMDWAIQTAPAASQVRQPPPPMDVSAVDDFHLPPLPGLKKRRLSVGQVTAIVLALLCVLIAVATQGLGFWLFVILAPVFILLAWPGRQPTPEGYLPAMTWWAAAAAVLLVVVSFVITFVAVCFPIGFIAFAQSFENPNPPASANIIAVAAWGLGLLAAGAVAWLLIRRFWPRGGRR